MTKKEIRQLDNNEKKFAQKVVDGKTAEKKHVELMIEYNQFMLDKMLESNYLEKRREFKRQTDDLKNELNVIQRNIDITTKQIAEGVEIKGDVGFQTPEIPGMVE